MDWLVSARELARGIGAGEMAAAGGSGVEEEELRGRWGRAAGAAAAGG